MNKKTILAYAVGPIGSAILSFASVPLIAWFFSVEDVGKIAIFNVVVSLATLVFCLGLDQAFVREYHSSENKARLIKLVMLPGLILLVIIIVGSVTYDSSLISKWVFDVPSQSLAILVMVCFFLQYISRFLSLILRMQDRALAYSMSQLLPKLFFVMFLMLGVAIGRERDLLQLLSAYTLSACLVFIIYVFNTRRDWLPAMTANVELVQMRPLLHFGLPLVFGSLASWGLNVMDKLFLRYYSTFAELGVYSLTMSVAAVATLFAGIFNTIWAPLVYRWLNEGKVDTQKIDAIGEHVLAAVYFAIVACGLFSWVIPYLLPAQYAAIEYLLPICLFSPLLYTLSEVTAVGISIARKTLLSMLASVLAMLTNLLGNYLLVPQYGAVGAATSTLLAFIFFYVLRTEFSKQVWRPIATRKTYTVLAVLTVYVLLNVWVIKGNYIGIIVAAGLILLGGVLFFNTIQLLWWNLKHNLHKSKVGA